MICFQKRIIVRSLATVFVIFNISYFLSLFLVPFLSYFSMFNNGNKVQVVQVEVKIILITEPGAELNDIANHTNAA
jgi:hypothetical protein